MHWHAFNTVLSDGGVGGYTTESTARESFFFYLHAAAVHKLKIVVMDNKDHYSVVDESGKEAYLKFTSCEDDCLILYQ